EPIDARPVSRIERLVVWCRRKPAAAALLAVTAAALLAVLTGTFAFAVLQGEAATEERRLRKDAERLQGEAEHANRLAQARRRAARAAGVREDLGHANRPASVDAWRPQEPHQRHLLFPRWALAGHR